MNNDILLLELKRKRALTKLAAEPTLSPAIEDTMPREDLPEEEDEVEVIDEAPEDEVEVIDEGSGEVVSEWSEETPTKLTVDPARARSKVERYSTDPAQIEGMTATEMQYMQERANKWHQYQSEQARGMVPGKGGQMTEEARQKALERTKRDHPEMFDPKKIEQSKGYKRTYHYYQDPIFPTSDRYRKLQTHMNSSKSGEKLDEDLSAQLSGLLSGLVGKVFIITTGTPTLPKQEEVKIVDVDPGEQKIILQVEGTTEKYYTSYDDFFYHKKYDGITDAQGAGLNPPKKISSKPGFFSRLLGRAKA